MPPSSELSSAHINNVTSINQKSTTESHVPSSVQADTLFNFTRELDWLLSTLKNQSLCPRYNIEDIRYLKIKKIPHIAFPMKCFCDINLHKLNEHLAWYGYYGIAFRKAWGMLNKIQPVHYMNPESPLIADFSKAFNDAVTQNPSDEIGMQLLDHMLHELMYFKPYQGLMCKPGQKTRQQKCFSDESEWRYIPKVNVRTLEQIYLDSSVLNENVLSYLNNQIQTDYTLSLRFNYDDVKYIIVKNCSDFTRIIDFLQQLDIEAS